MANRLEILLESKPDVHLSEAWGKISIRMFSSEDITVLLDTEWDLLDLAEWFGENKSFLCHQSLLIEGDAVKEGESLARAMHRFQTKDFDSPQAFNEWHDKLNELSFWTRHSITGALQGAAVPHILIGCNRNQGEISHVQSDSKLYTKSPSYCYPGEWSFNFDMNGFLQQFEQELQSVLKGIAATVSDSQTKAAFNTVIKGLHLEHQQSQCCSG